MKDIILKLTDKEYSEAKRVKKIMHYNNSWVHFIMICIRNRAKRGCNNGK